MPPACTDLGQRIAAFSVEVIAPSGSMTTRFPGADDSANNLGQALSLRKFCLTKCLLGSIAFK